jgi:hypothetical protein
VRQVKIPMLEAVNKVFASPVWDLARHIPGTLDEKVLETLRSKSFDPENLASAFTIVEGLIQVPQVNWNLEGTSVSLSGGIGLDKTLQFLGHLSIDRKWIEALIKNPRLKETLLGNRDSFHIPLKVSGTAGEPRVLVDEDVVRKYLTSFLKEEAEQKARETLGDLLKTSKTPSEPAVPQKIKDLFKKF